MKMHKINIASEFSVTPAGRYRTDGPHSGEAFRDDVLLPALNAYDSVTVDMNGTLGFGSSFLEEAFGGLVRVKKFSAEDLMRKLTLTCDIQQYADRAKQYIAEAEARAKVKS